LNIDYGSYIWLSASVLARYIIYKKAYIEGKTVLEIGCGTALPGILAAKLGAKVILSDSKKSPYIFENILRNIKENHLTNVDILQLDWGLFNSAILNCQPIDVVLGSDCLYNSKDFDKVLSTVSYLLANNLMAEFWMAYESRRQVKIFV
ncbi:hypothetical protein HELRODRAFT_85562, partial [Helobdella robusta]|uniref:Methyltransferase domain-containing protein n=1 Tax=Helobdella robusta TaxID=6412 RepID=T1G5Z3_HELRO